jgi:hypothetical protein
MCNASERLNLLAAENVAKRSYFKQVRYNYLKTGKPAVVTAFNLFQTPPAVARRMVQLAGDLAGKRILEPSAGLGRILDQIPVEYYGNVIACDICPDCVRHTYNNYPLIANLKQCDFLTFDDEKGFDVILMNPPFKQGLDIKHIKHAMTLLNPGGVLIALCYDGVRQNKALRPLANSWELLPHGSFKSEGTQADIVLITMQK